MQEIKRELRFTPEAAYQLKQIEDNPALKGVLKQVRKTLGLLQANIRSKSLQTHEYESLTKRYGQKIFEAYAQQDTPGAYRVFWHYGPDEQNEKGERIPTLTIIMITPHP